MPKARDFRPTIEKLSNEGKRPSEIVKKLGLPRATVYRCLNRIKLTGSTNDLPRSGRPKTATNPQIVKRIREKIRRNPKRSIRQMAKDENISATSMRRIVHKNLQKYPYKIQKAHGLTQKMMDTRKSRCKELLKRFPTPARASSILFTDECLFTVEQFVNHQNDRVLAGSLQEASQKGRIASRTAHPQAIMAFGAVTGDGKMPLVFIDQGVKVKSQNYLDDVLKKEVLPWANSHFKGQQWTYQQDSAPAHKARIVQAWCQTNFPGFISSSEWPPNSPDLNPLDYSIWSIMKTKACSTRHPNLASLQQALEKAWDEIDPEHVRAAVEAFPKRLKACITENGGIFEI